ncbi:MAG: imidazole glycerol phosphate synthase subunit HisH [Yaniella sp.]|uniref:imidazole glycerol phosphate synthase subunit HisH n=1 Tax=Yaniella sp. TaxID=2773929 RepID=UPI001859C14A|nr:imidazole glycerol phosphate synthase subunit HisH [Yaniella sp.]NLZ97384.1 imidazole glycerol phosphate synthase subunit HisH [Micrococcus sp.]MDN5730341.1 imidazole glycerol phosphate synthase subunit HisH [Yaniella sp.]MDN5814336.1 imidazole glycerol phosphate synthase subunit HisH [Yaniella sp.]MDN5816781.1 imidazole glycerol phosphate synthase subunit HisH [Yaniella sp.]MDN5837371.1 imidazole glycerol phosphate synthase subunit HisH [Yaniella sp.]
MSSKELTIAIADYGIGNLGSLANAFTYIGANVVITSRGADLVAADGMVLPGNGAFSACKQAMDKLSISRWVGQRVSGGRPVLGICVGHQVLFDDSTEFGNHEGLGEWPGTVEKLRAETVPHLGWRTIRPAENSTLFAGLHDERFYFAHSYAVLEWNFDQGMEVMEPPQVSWSNHGGEFIAAVENGPLTGVQFHPELSGHAGIQLLKNWLGTL